MTSSVPHGYGLASFVRRVNARAQAAIRDTRLHPAQTELLDRLLTRVSSQVDPDDWGQPLALLYLVFRAGKRRADEQAELVGSFCLLYLLALDLFDDVQDDDLRGKPHEAAGPALAVNDAIALLFLALDALRSVIDLERDPRLRAAYLSTFNRLSLVTVGAQHADLLGDAGDASPEAVLTMHRGKTATVALFTECGALLAGRAPAEASLYAQLGEDLACLVQIVDDLRDIYGKDESPDLKAQKLTYPLACFQATASPEHAAELDRLLLLLPDSLPAIRNLFHEAGTVERCAVAIDSLRQGAHQKIATLAEPSAEHRLLLGVVDALAESIYAIDPVEETTRLFEPRGEFHALVRRAASTFSARLGAWGAPECPRLEPWHLPFYLFEPERRVLYYPDVDGLPEEVLPFHAQLWGTDLEGAARALREQSEAVVAHEMFHLWRDEAGRLTSDSWHEEHVANRLAVAYCQRFSGARLDELAASCRARSRRAAELETREIQELLRRCSLPTAVERGYGLDERTSALVHFRMIDDFSRARLDLEEELRAHLGAEQYGVSAAE